MSSRNRRAVSFKSSKTSARSSRHSVRSASSTMARNDDRDDIIRGSSLGALVEEPMQQVADFLERQPNARNVSIMLDTYKAYVVELADLADDMTATERSWKRDVPAQYAHAARHKFEALECNSKLVHVLDAYREATRRLERTMKRLASDGRSPSMDTKRTPRSARSDRSEPHGAGGIMQLMNTGLDMLFGHESSESCGFDVDDRESLPGTSTQCLVTANSESECSMRDVSSKYRVESSVESYKSPSSRTRSGHTSPAKRPGGMIEPPPGGTIRRREPQTVPSKPRGSPIAEQPYTRPATVEDIIRKPVVGPNTPRSLREARRETVVMPLENTIHQKQRDVPPAALVVGTTNPAVQIDPMGSLMSTRGSIDSPIYTIGETKTDREARRQARERRGSQEAPKVPPIDLSYTRSTTKQRSPRSPPGMRSPGSVISAVGTSVDGPTSPSNAGRNSPTKATSPPCADTSPCYSISPCRSPCRIVSPCRPTSPCRVVTPPSPCRTVSPPSSCKTSPRSPCRSASPYRPVSPCHRGLSSPEPSGSGKPAPRTVAPYSVGTGSPPVSNSIHSSMSPPQESSPGRHRSPIRMISPCPAPLHRDCSEERALARAHVQIASPPPRQLSPESYGKSPPTLVSPCPSTSIPQCDPLTQSQLGCLSPDHQDSTQYVYGASPPLPAGPSQYRDSSPQSSCSTSSNKDSPSPTSHTNQDATAYYSEKTSQPATVIHREEIYTREVIRLGKEHSAAKAVRCETDESVHEVDVTSRSTREATKRKTAKELSYSSETSSSPSRTTSAAIYRKPRSPTELGPSTSRTNNRTYAIKTKITSNYERKYADYPGPRPDQSPRALRPISTCDAQPSTSSNSCGVSSSQERSSPRQGSSGKENTSPCEAHRQTSLQQTSPCEVHHQTTMFSPHTEVRTTSYHDPSPCSLQSRHTSYHRPHGHVGGLHSVYTSYHNQVTDSAAGPCDVYDSGRGEIYVTTQTFPPQGSRSGTPQLDRGKASSSGGHDETCTEYSYAQRSVIASGSGGQTSVQYSKSKNMIVACENEYSSSGHNMRQKSSQQQSQKTAENPPGHYTTIPGHRSNFDSSLNKSEGGVPARAVHSTPTHNLNKRSPPPRDADRAPYSIKETVSSRQDLVESLAQEAERMLACFSPVIDTNRSQGGRTTGSGREVVTPYSAETPESEVSSKVSSGELNSEIRRIREEIVNLSRNCPTCQLLSEEKGILEEKLADAKRRAQERAEEVTAAKRQVEKLNMELSNTQTRLSCANSELSVYKEKSKLSDRKASTEERLEELLERQMDEKKEAITQLRSVECLLQQLKVDKDNLGAENLILKQELHKVKQDKNVFNEQVRALQYEQQENQEQKKALTLQVTALQRELSTYISSHDKNEEAINVNVRARASLEMNLDSLHQEKQRIEVLNQELRQEKNLWKQNAEHHQNELHLARQRIAEMHKELATQSRMTAQFDQQRQQSGTRDSSITTCSECQMTINPKHLEPIVNSLRKWSDIGTVTSTHTTCQECLKKEAELARLSQQLIGLYNQTKSNNPNPQSDHQQEEVRKLQAEVHRLTNELDSVRKEQASRLAMSASQVKTTPSTPRKSLEAMQAMSKENLSKENTKLQDDLERLKTELSRIQADNTEFSGLIKACNLEKAKLQENAIRNMENQASAKQVERLEEENRALRDTINGLRREDVPQCEKERMIIKEKELEIKHLSEQIESLKAEIRLLKTNDQTEILQTQLAARRQQDQAEIEHLRRRSAELQDEIKQLRESQNNKRIDPEMIHRKDEQIEQLQEELNKLRKLRAEYETSKGKIEIKESELNKLKNELKLARQDIELYHKGQGPNSKTAYIVKMRDETIEGRNEKIADLERHIAKVTERNADRRKMRRPDESPSPKQQNKSEMLLLMADDTSRLKQRNEKLENDNSKLAEKIRERDAKMFEMETEIDWLTKGSNQKEMITNYTHKLKSGEEEMGRLHQQMEVITQRHSTLLLAKENEILEVRTHYAKQLSQLIDDCVNRNNIQEFEMKKLCEELDNLEKRNFELEHLMKEYESVKTDQVPKLRKELDALRLSKNELRSEFEQCNRQMKELQKEVQMAHKEKRDLTKQFESDMSRVKHELDNTKRDIHLRGDKAKSQVAHKDAEVGRLKLELNNMSATIQERDGAVTHWKIKCEDINRQIKDVEERHRITIKAKNSEISSLNKQIMDLTRSVDKTSAVNEKELFRLQSQFRELQRQHLDILEQNDATIKLKEDEMKRLYSEIGEMSAHLHAATKEKDKEIARLRNDLKRQKAEKDSFLEECSNTIQEKQAEVRKLVADIEQLEVEAARLHALKEQELAGVHGEYQIKLEQLGSDRAHLLAIKDNEIRNLSSEIERLMNDAKHGGSSIAEMKKKIFQLEQDKNELLLLKDQWQADMDKLFTEFEQCKTDKHSFEEMVEHMSKEMEERIEGLKADHKHAIAIKDGHIRDLYGKVEKIAKERGDMSAHLHKVLQEKEAKIEELFSKVKEYDACLDQAEKDFKNKLHRKSQEIKWLRGEIKKMGDEGVRLLDMREREITEMRTHLKNILKVMEHKQKQAKSSSHLIITRPQLIKASEPHLKPLDKTEKSKSGAHRTKSTPSKKRMIRRT